MPLDQSKADLVERFASIPPATYAGATLFGMPVSELTSWIMFGYAVLLVAWHLKSKWFAPKAAPKAAE
jgi:hypothetical protein